MTIKIRGDEGPASALDGWGVVVEVDAANEVTVSVAGLDRAVAVGLLREAADVLESDGFVSECPVCSQPFVSYEYEGAPESFIGDGQFTVPLAPTTRTVCCANGHDHRVVEAVRDERGIRVRLARP